MRRLWLTALCGLVLSTLSPAPSSAQVAPTPVAEWLFDEGSGTVAADTVGSNHGALLNGATFAPGKSETAVSFDGVDDRVEVPASASLELAAQVTVETWIRVEQVVESLRAAPIVAKWGDTDYGSAGYGLFLSAGTSRPLFAVSSTGRDIGAVYAPSALSLNQWHYLAGTYDGSILKLYVDGALVAQAARSGGINATAAPVVMGNYHPTLTAGGGFAPIDGLLDNASIYAQALSAETIAARAAPTASTPTGILEHLIQEVRDLVAVGTLNQRQGNGLIQKLQAAIASIDRSNTGAACRQVAAFVQEMRALIQSGAVPASVGQHLIDEATAAMQQLNC